MKFFRGLLIIISVFFLYYLALPSPSFPEPPSPSQQSQEPGDTEDVASRRAYFTDVGRVEAREHYLSLFRREPLFLGMRLPTFYLNYPPEEAQTIIRDQTRSSYLEEVVHPLRESVFINGFIPESEKDTILIDGRVWYQKLTIRYVEANPLYRLLAGAGTLVFIYFLVVYWERVVLFIRKK